MSAVARGEDARRAAERAVLAHATRRGLLAAAEREQLEQEYRAACQGAEPAPPLLPLLRRYVAPAALGELRAVYEQALAAPPASGGGPGDSARIGPYRVVRELARGGMGVVYLAEHLELGRRVALKQILSAGAGEDGAAALARFGREAEAVARLEHPHVIRVYEVGQDGGAPFIAMDLVEGESLESRLRREGALPPREAAALLERVAEAVEHAHGRGVLHRDLKPANVLLDPALGPKVTDFGLARLEDRERLTRTGATLGTPAYMAPEQAAGELDRIGPAADVYGLGATLYALLTGRAPFEGASAINVIAQVLRQPPTPPRRLRPELDRELEAVVLTCLEKEPHERYPSARALADDLRRWLAGEPVTAAPPTWAQRLRKWARRRRALATASAVGVLAVALTAGGGALVMALRPERLDAYPRARPAPLAGEAALEDARQQADLEHAPGALNPRVLRARDLYLAGRRDEALAALEPLTRTSPEALLLRGRIHAAGLDGHLAVADFGEVHRRAPKDALGVEARARRAFAQATLLGVVLEEAEAELVAALADAAPEDRSVRALIKGLHAVLLARERIRQDRRRRREQRDADAELLAAEALELADEAPSAPARSARGIVLERRGELAAALDEFLAAQAADPLDPAPFTQSARVRIAQAAGAPEPARTAALERAAADLARAEALAPGRPGARRWLAELHLAAGRPREAARVLDGVIEEATAGRHVDDALRLILYRLRARARRAVGDEAGARADVVRATPSVRPMLAHLDELLAERRFEAARAYFEDWIGARDKPPRQPLREVARRFADAGDRDGALAVLEAALREFPRFVLVRLDMARLHHAAGDRERARAALAAAERLLDKEPVGEVAAALAEVRALLER